MKHVKRWALPVIAATVITLGLAAIGEPQSAWFVCDILGVEMCK